MRTGRPTGRPVPAFKPRSVEGVTYETDASSGSALGEAEWPTERQVVNLRPHRSISPSVYVFWWRTLSGGRHSVSETSDPAGSDGGLDGDRSNTPATATMCWGANNDSHLAR